MAACNCKCQDPSGEGPQWNDLTKAVCDQKLGDETGLCQFDKSFLSDKNNQVCLYPKVRFYIDCLFILVCRFWLLH